jgi:hypothetical protein
VMNAGTLSQTEVGALLLLGVQGLFSRTLHLL